MLYLKLKTGTSQTMMLKRATLTSILRTYNVFATPLSVKFTNNREVRVEDQTMKSSKTSEEFLVINFKKVKYIINVV